MLTLIAEDESRLVGSTPTETIASYKNNIDLLKLQAN